MEKDGRDIDYVTASRVLRTALAVIVDITSAGEPVDIKQFGEFSPRVSNYKSCQRTSTTITVRLRMCEDWKRKCKVSSQMRKYAYEKEKEDKLVKKAAEKGRCPVCGRQTEGQPPVCPSCGSKPFERQEEKRG